MSIASTSFPSAWSAFPARNGRSVRGRCRGWAGRSHRTSWQPSRVSSCARGPARRRSRQGRTPPRPFAAGLRSIVLGLQSLLRRSFYRALVLAGGSRGVAELFERALLSPGVSPRDLLQRLAGLLPHFGLLGLVGQVLGPAEFLEGFDQRDLGPPGGRFDRLRVIGTLLDEGVEELLRLLEKPLGLGLVVGALRCRAETPRTSRSPTAR